MDTVNKTDKTVIRKIFDEALTKGECYENLRSLCKDIGHRLSGSPQADQAVEWGKNLMQEMGLDNVFLQEVMVPHWERGKREEISIQLAAGEEKVSLPLCALGSSIGTPAEGITAEIIEVQNFDELAELGEEKVKGKIVFFNRPMNPKLINTFAAYGGCVNQRSQGASYAAKYGGVGALVRSMSLRHDDHPHTGVMWYNPKVSDKKVPGAAISTAAANQLSEMLKKNPKLEASLVMDCKNFPDKKSYNVIGELRGSEFPEEYIVVGGHLDSWDKGEGAHDDGAGVVHSLEVVRLFLSMGIKPKRTIRVVLFMNEENGAKGAAEYARVAKEKNENHLAALESDRGGFTPRGFTIDADSATILKVQSWKPLLVPYGLHDIIPGYAGVDIKPLKGQGVKLFGYLPDSQRYFDHHHADTDVFEAVNKRELELGAASMAAFIYLIDKYGL